MLELLVGLIILEEVEEARLPNYKDLKYGNACLLSWVQHEAFQPNYFEIAFMTECKFVRFVMKGRCVRCSK